MKKFYYSRFNFFIQYILGFDGQTHKMIQKTAQSKKEPIRLEYSLQNTSLNFIPSLAKQYVLFTKKDKTGMTTYLKQFFGEYTQLLISNISEDFFSKILFRNKGHHQITAIHCAIRDFTSTDKLNGEVTGNLE